MSLEDLKIKIWLRLPGHKYLRQGIKEGIITVSNLKALKHLHKKTKDVFKHRYMIH